MRLLQRYILLELLRIFVFVLSILTVLLVFVGVFREVSENGLGFLHILQILPYIIPSLLPFTIPATLLLSVCVVYGRMAGDQEITAAKAAGISVMSLLGPSFFFGALMSVCSLLLTDQVIPWAEMNFQKIVTAAIEDVLLDQLRTQHQFAIGSDAITVREVRGRRLIWPTFRYQHHGDKSITARAQEAELVKFDFENQQVFVRLIRAQVDIPGHGRTWFEDVEHPFPLPLGKYKPKPRHINVEGIQAKLNTLEASQSRVKDQKAIEVALALAIGNFELLGSSELRQFDKQLAANRNEFQRLHTELHSRFALACSCFFFVLVGSPFAVLQAKRQFLTNFFICFVPVILLYYPIVLLGMNLSKSGTVDAAWAMWVGNFLIGLVGLVVLQRVSQH